MSWLPADFRHPLHVPVDEAHHLRPIRADDAAIDYPAVMGSRERLWSIYGADWGWPAPTITFEADREDLARHEREIEAHESFNYALLDTAETTLLGCVYIDPAPTPPTDAVISWWVVDSQVNTPLETALNTLIPTWITTTWPFQAPHYPHHP